MEHRERDIKALSPSEIAEYEGGAGMGLALAAELNSYPGPVHVLEMADQLKLSSAQRTESQRVYDRMRAEAVRIGEQIVSGERELDRLFARRTVTDTALRDRVRALGRMRSELRYTHLRAHLEMAGILSDDQISEYDRLRGYGSDGPGLHHEHGRSAHP